MEKNFDDWNEIKKEIETTEKIFHFNNREIWWSTIGINLKNESCGKGKKYRRPVLILKKLSTYSFIGIPLSTKIKNGSWFYNYNINGEDFTALLYQVKMFNSCRLQRNIGEISKNDFKEIKKRLKFLLNL